MNIHPPIQATLRRRPVQGLGSTAPLRVVVDHLSRRDSAISWSVDLPMTRMDVRLGVRFRFSPREACLPPVDPRAHGAELLCCLFIGVAQDEEIFSEGRFDQLAAHGLQVREMQQQ